MTHRLLTVGIVSLLCIGSNVTAQQPAPAEKPDPATADAPKPIYTPLRLQVTVSRYQGDKKITSLPYSLSLNIGGPRLTFRMGAQVPYATTQGNDATKTPSYSYRDVGISIDVSGQAVVGPGLYKMDFTVVDSTLSSSNQIQGAPTIAGVPIFRNFNTSGSLILKDGQTGQLTTAADPITGETMRVDVTLMVVK